MRTDRDSTLRMRRAVGLALSALAVMGAAAAQAQTPAAGTAAAARPGLPEHADRAGAQAAAEQGLADYVGRKQQQGAAATSAFNLTGADDLARTRIAGGFEVYTIAPQDLVAGRSDLRHMAQPTGVWRFFVRLGKQPVGLVTVQRVDGRWEAVSFGGAGIAQELSALMTEHALVGADNLRFIRVHQAQTDMLEIVSPTDLQARYALLASAREALSPALEATTAAVAPSQAAPRLLDTYELLEPLRIAVKRNLSAKP